jgi:hypothetical protein
VTAAIAAPCVSGGGQTHLVNLLKLAFRQGMEATPSLRRLGSWRIWEAKYRSIGPNNGSARGRCCLVGGIVTTNILPTHMF